MAGLWTRQDATVRLFVLGGIALQLVTWLANVILFPSVVVTIVAGVTGIRGIGRDDDDAVLRIGVALLSSLVASVLSLLSGALLFVLIAWSSSGLLFEGWRRLRLVATQRRRAWGIKHQDIVDRRIALEKRRDTLRDRPGG